tara:strand:- start:8244 stop:8519 length:276 start_codon:yes stop_codon:yes gene_type:complete
MVKVWAFIIGILIIIFIAVSSMLLFQDDTGTPINPNTEETICNCQEDSYNCSDFSDQIDAQSCYDSCLEQTGTDIHQLDKDGEGLACESLS